MTVVVLHAMPRRYAEILAVGGRSYAFGLRWTSAAVRASLDSEATAARPPRSGANFVAIHRGYCQFGLASIAGVPPPVCKAHSTGRRAASRLSPHPAGAATLAAFPLDDGRWLVMAIDRKGFLPDGDLIVADAEQARARIARWIAQSPTSWRRKFVPDAWGIPDSKSVDPTTLLAGAAAHARLDCRYGCCRTVGGSGSRSRRRSAFLSAVSFRLQCGSKPRRRPRPSFRSKPPKPVAALWTPAGLDDRCSASPRLRAAQRYNAVPGWLPAKYTCQDGKVRHHQFLSGKRTAR